VKNELAASKISLARRSSRFSRSSRLICSASAVVVPAPAHGRSDAAWLSCAACRADPDPLPDPLRRNVQLSRPRVWVGSGRGPELYSVVEFDGTCERRIWDGSGIASTTW
jgi:hypothetical protein